MDLKARLRAFPRPGPKMALAGILLLAGLARIFFLMELERDPAGQGPRLDGLYNRYWAHALVTGDWTPPAGESDPKIQTSPYFRPPGYPWGVAIVMRLSGDDSPRPLRLVQMLMGLLCIALTYAQGRRIAGVWAGVAAAALLAGTWQGLYYEGRWLETAPLTLLLLLAVSTVQRVADRPTAARAALAGSVLGLAAWVRPNTLILAPFFMAWLFVSGRRRGWQRAAHLRTMLLPILLAGLLLIPLVRNRRVSGEWVLISSNAGVNLLLGTERDSTLTHGNWLTENWSCFDAPKIVNRVADMEGRPLRPGEASAALSRIAWNIYRENPVATLRLLGWKALLFWAPGEIPSNVAETLDRDASPVLRHMPVRFPLLLALGLLGIGLAWRNPTSPAAPDSGGGHDGAVLLAGVVLLYFLGFLPFVMAGQYRVPLLPFLAVFGGIAIDRVRIAIHHRALRAVVLYLLILAGLTALVLANPADVPPDRAHWHYMRAQLLGRTGQPDREEAEYRLALQMDPNSVEVLLNLGILLFERNDAPQAAPLLMRANEIRETALGNLYLGRIFESKGRWELALAHLRAAEALDDIGRADIPYRLGMVHMDLHQCPEAVEAFQRALDRSPDFDAARFGRGWARLEAGDPAAALDDFIRLRDHATANPGVLYQGGRALRALRRYDEARRWWTEYLRLVPDDDDARRDMQSLP